MLAAEMLINDVGRFSSRVFFSLDIAGKRLNRGSYLCEFIEKLFPPVTNAGSRS